MCRTAVQGPTHDGQAHVQYRLRALRVVVRAGDMRTQRPRPQAKRSAQAPQGASRSARRRARMHWGSAVHSGNGGWHGTAISAPGGEEEAPFELGLLEMNFRGKTA